MTNWKLCANIDGGFAKIFAQILSSSWYLAQIGFSLIFDNKMVDKLKFCANIESGFSVIFAQIFRCPGCPGPPATTQCPPQDLKILSTCFSPLNISFFNYMPIGLCYIHILWNCKTKNLLRIMGLLLKLSVNLQRANVAL